MADEGKTLKSRWLKSESLASMLTVQLIGTGMQLLSRTVLVNGTNILTLLAYRHIVAALCVALLAVYMERREEKKFGWSVWFWLFVNALTGATFMGLNYYGLRDTTATYSVNFLNLVPVGTFVLSLITRVERVELRTKAGIVKTVGALLSLAGALTTSLYSGHEFYIRRRHIDSHATASISHPNWTRGTLLLVGGCLCYSAWFIVQVKLQQVFPFKYWSTMLTCIMVSAISSTAGLCADRSVAAWKLGWDLQLATIVYSGLFSTATAFCLLQRVISKKGPTYPSMFNPISTILVAIFSALLLGEVIHLGTLIGMVLIISGLYSFLWGKRIESSTAARQSEGAAAAEEI